MRELGSPVEFDNVAKRTAMAVNLSESTVKRIAREFLQQSKVESPEKRGRRSECGTMENTDNFMEGVVRRRIHRFYLEKQHPTSDKVLAALAKR